MQLLLAEKWPGQLDRHEHSCIRLRDMRDMLGALLFPFLMLSCLLQISLDGCIAAPHRLAAFAPLPLYSC